jgi:hypothetical protein
MALLLDAIPEDIAALRGKLQVSFDKRNALLGRDADLAKAEPAQVTAIATARAALDDAEADFAVATDEDEKALRVTRDRRRRELADAEEALRQTQNARRGIVRRLAAADAEIEQSYPPFRNIMIQFGAEICSAYRTKLFDAIDGRESLIRVLRLGWALKLAIPQFTGTLSLTLSDINIGDIGSRPGRPVSRIIQGEKIWLDDASTGESLRDFGDEPEVVALHQLLRPLAATYEAATVRVRRIEEERDRVRISAPPAQPPAPEPEKISGEEWMARQPTEAEHRAEMAAQRARPAGITPPVKVVDATMYPNGRFSETPLA